MEKTTKFGGTVEYKAIKGTAAVEIEISSAGAGASIMVNVIRMIALVHERLALAIADQTTLRLLEPPMSLQPIHLLMLWTSSAETDPGHTWLRRRILSLVAELDGTTGAQRSLGTSSRLEDCDQPAVAGAA